MSKRLMVFAAAVALLLAGAPGAGAEGSPIGTGLWPTTVIPTQIAGFDTSSVELGVKFTTSASVDIVGVRAYRPSLDPVTGSLWAKDGVRLAGPAGLAGTVAAGSWQDMPFGAPVAMSPGQTFIASYFAPAGNYPYTYGYFTNGSFTRGPLTATQSVSGDGNGVFCYSSSSCSPAGTYFDSNYWVSPIWRYRYAGFFAPVDAGAWNSAKAGSAVPVKFSLAGDQGLGVLKAGFPQATTVACPGASTPVDPIEETVTADSSGLKYDSAAGQYVYVWKTAKTWSGRCMRFDLGLIDDTARSFTVQFK